MTIRRVRDAVLLTCLVACGSAKPAPATPKPLDPKQIAHDIHVQWTEMAEITNRLREACPKMADELTTLFVRMRVTVDEANRAVQDPALAKQLTSELRGYDETDRDLPKAVFANLVACKDDPAVREVMSTMPVPQDQVLPGGTQ